MGRTARRPTRHKVRSRGRVQVQARLRGRPDAAAPARPERGFARVPNRDSVVNLDTLAERFEADYRDHAGTAAQRGLIRSSRRRSGTGRGDMRRSSPCGRTSQWQGGGENCRSRRGHGGTWGIVDNALQNLFAVTDLRNRVLFTLALPRRVPGRQSHPRRVEHRARSRSCRADAQHVFGLYDMFSGGNLSQVTISRSAVMPISARRSSCSS